MLVLIQISLLSNNSSKLYKLAHRQHKTNKTTHKYIVKVNKVQRIVVKISMRPTTNWYA